VRILLVSDFSPPTPGGLEAHVQRLAEALIRRGHEVAMVTGTAQPDSLPGLATMLSVETVLSRAPQLFRDKTRQFPPPFPDAIFRRTVRRLAGWWRPDVIHAHGWCAFSCYWPGSPPLVVTLHDHGLRCPKRTLFRGGVECVTGRGARCITCRGDQAIVKRLPLAAAMSYSVPALVEHASRFIAVSRSVAQRTAELGDAASKIEVIPNFLEVGSMNGTVQADPSTLLFVGGDSPHKGRAVLIDAFRQLPSGFARLVLVGSNTSVNMPGVSTLGYMRGAALWEQYQRASVVVVPSLCPEACPTVALEAMAHGRPVVGSRIGGIPDIIEDGRNGLLVPPNDPAALAHNLQRILTDHDLRHRLGSDARSRSKRFSSDAVVPQIEEIYASARKTRAGADPLDSDSKVRG
jgi:glycosyltransferase involved in cell wall biosynthesis